MTRLRFVSARGGSAFMEELLEVVADEVRALGADVTSHRGSFPDDDGDEDVYVVVPHEYFVLTDPAAHPDDGRLARTIGFCVEHPGNATFEVSAQWASRLGGAVDINRDGAEELARRGVRVQRFRLGYAPRWDHWHGDDDRERPIDVTYLGTTDARRDFLLGCQARALSEWRARLLLPPHEQMTRPRPDFLMGPDKYEHLASSKVLVNLHRGASRSLEWVRVLEAMCNGCVVVSEHSTDFEPFEPGTHLAFARGTATVAVAASLLRRPARIRELRERAYECCRGQLSMSQSASALLDLAASLVGRGAPPAAVAVPDAPAVRLPTAPEPPPPPTGLPALADWMAGAPGQVRSLLADAHAHALRTGPIGVVEHRYGGRRSPVVDVVVSRARDEVGLARTLRGLERQDVATRVLVGTAGSGGGGLGVAHARVRNALLERCDAPLVVVMGADQELLPGALRRLLEPLEGDGELDAAYGMLFDPDRGTLWNALPLEAERLARRAYVHAPMLLRADVLASLGGYDEDPALIAYEDHALLLRFVGAGHVAAMVPEIVGVGAEPSAGAFAPSAWLPEATLEALAPAGAP